MAEPLNQYVDEGVEQAVKHLATVCAQAALELPSNDAAFLKTASTFLRSASFPDLALSLPHLATLLEQQARQTTDAPALMHIRSELEPIIVQLRAVWPPNARYERLKLRHANFGRESEFVTAICEQCRRILRGVPPKIFWVDAPVHWSLRELEASMSLMRLRYNRPSLSQVQNFIDGYAEYRFHQSLRGYHVVEGTHEREQEINELVAADEGQNALRGFRPLIRSTLDLLSSCSTGGVRMIEATAGLTAMCGRLGDALYAVAACISPSTTKSTIAAVALGLQLQAWVGLFILEEASGTRLQPDWLWLPVPEDGHHRLR